MDERKGFLTREQEKVLDDLIELKGVAEALDGLGIRLLDDQGLEFAKGKLIEKLGDKAEEILPIVYEIIDTIFGALDAVVKAKE
jgi:hypothetical protein